VLASDLVDRRVAAIAAVATAPALAVKATSTTIPIVFVIGSDPRQVWPCRQPQPTRGQCHRRELPGQPAAAEAVRIAARAGARRGKGRPARESDQSEHGIRHKKCAVREFATAGGLMSYGTSVADASRQAGVYSGRILKGEKPANLPVMQPTKFELIINLRTA